MAELIWERIKIYTTFTLHTLREFQMEIKPNQHAVMKIRAFVDKDTGFSELEQAISDAEIKAVEIDEISGEEKRLPLFVGIIDEAKIKAISGQYEITIKAVSATRKLDECRYSRSYQEIKQNYTTPSTKPYHSRPKPPQSFPSKMTVPSSYRSFSTWKPTGNSSNEWPVTSP